MVKVKENLTLSLLVALVGVIAFLLYRDQQRESEFRQLMTQNQQVGKDGRRPSDPYLGNELKNRIVKGYGELQICYKEFLKTNPNVTDGELKMDWQIDSDGEVISPEVVMSPFKSDTFHKCMAGKIALWKFPEPPIKKYVTHTFKFEKKD